jgi:hypothetical protein
MAEMGIPGQEPRKGMSKGCLVGLIVVGVLVVMVMLAGVMFYLNRDELAKVGVNMTVSQIQQELMANPVEGVDTVYVNMMADAFQAKVKESELAAEEYGYFLQTTQSVKDDGGLDAEDVDELVAAMVTTFPDLRNLMRDRQEPEVDDSVGGEDDSLGTEY